MGNNNFEIFIMIILGLLRKFNRIFIISNKIELKIEIFNMF